tara:strand:+ start:503 stop:1606 length:1104 start_codon:yes stop_codon:yes gene_type:complete
MNLEKVSYHSISPDKVFRGNKAWEDGKELITSICKYPLLLGRSKSTSEIRSLIERDLNQIGVETICANLINDCCEEDLKFVSNIARRHNCDAVIAAGGGKVLDAGKLIADRLSLPCVTIPLSASTCAGWTALSNIYSTKGAFIKDVELASCPNILIFDHSFVRTAPPRTLASGIADGLAKWYEASLSNISSKDGFVQQSVQMARVLRDQLFIDGVNAYKNPRSDSWERVAEGCSLTAGVIGGMGGSLCRTAVAHPIHNGITQLSFANKSLHGEIVGFGILIQLHLEEIYSKNKLAKQARKQLIEFLKQLNLPTTIEALGLEELSITKLKQVSKFACKTESSIHLLPFSIDENMIFEAIVNSKVTSQI